jgi:flagellar protein FliO/FliZ
MDPLPVGLASLFWFVVVLAAIPLVLWLLKRASLGRAGGGGAALRTVATLPVGPAQRVVTIEVGEGEARRWLVLGVTAQQITALHEMAPTVLPPAPASEAALPFRQLLSQLGVGDSGARRAR